MKRKLEILDCSRGAPMGRRNNIPSDINTVNKLYLGKINMVDDCYDYGNAYWGGNFDNIGDMYWAQGESATEQVDIFVRALNRELAKEKILEEIPSAKFYR